MLKENPGLEVFFMPKGKKELKKVKGKKHEEELIAEDAAFEAEEPEPVIEEEPEEGQF